MDSVHSLTLDDVERNLHDYCACCRLVLGQHCMTGNYSALRPRCSLSSYVKRRQTSL